MADEPRSSQPSEEPPATPQVGVPPKLKVDTSRLKSETSRIELSAARPTPGAGPDSEPIKRATKRIDLSQTAATGAAPVPETPAKQTSRINLGDSMAGTAVGTSVPPQRSTSRIDLSGGQPPSPEPQVAQAKKMTARIDLAEAKPAAPGLAPEAPKRTTARIDLPGTATPVPPPMPTEPPPRTVRIKSPGAPTVAVKRMSELASSGDFDTSRKSETARIEMPAENIVEQPVTRRKTIRIKRPDAGLEPASHVVTIAREEGATAEPTGAPTETVAGEAEPGVAYSLMALAATVIVLVLIYVLAAQTIAPDLPFVGKI